MNRWLSVLAVILAVGIGAFAALATYQPAQAAIGVHIDWYPPLRTDPQPPGRWCFGLKGWHQSPPWPAGEYLAADVFKDSDTPCYGGDATHNYSAPAFGVLSMWTDGGLGAINLYIDDYQHGSMVCDIVL